MKILWMAAIVLFAVLELTTIQLISIWFAIGALASLVFAYIGFSSTAQIFAFLIVSAICVFLARPLIKKTIKNTESTNLDAIVGKKAVVTKDINNLKSSGEVEINGNLWSARSINDDIIEKDEIVTIEKIEGVKLIVKK
ncbi:MAG: NfeD family protein [Ruminococcaceae bacterium]|nr:NfeD family protein [Oscillospiraceae bacterium]